MASYVDYDKEYTCPDCMKVVRGYELLYKVRTGKLFVCPKCGAIQNKVRVYKALEHVEED